MVLGRGRMPAMATRINALGGVLRSWFAKVWFFGAAALGIYQFGCDQFDWPKLPVLWGMTELFVPWWGWLVIAQLGFTYGLFEYVRRLAPVSVPAAVHTRQQEWESIRTGLESVARSLGFALGTGGALRYRSAVSDAEGFLFQLAQRNNFEIPELRKDGEKIGCMRAILYITDLTPMLQLDDTDKTRARASQLTAWLNGLGEGELKELVKLDDTAGYFD